MAPEREELSAIRLRYTGGEKGWEASADGGAVSELGGEANRPKFVWTARSLPWALPDEASFGVEIADIDNRFNRETLTVAGLPEGRYELAIAEELVGEEFYTAEQLEQGIELQSFWERPQFQRARTVAALNWERYETTIRPLRDHWQKVKRTRVNFPEDTARLESLMKELLPQMDALRTQSKEKSDAIYKQAQPLARQYEIRPYFTPEERKAMEEARKKAEEEAAAKKKAEEEAAAKQNAEEDAKKAAEGSATTES